MKLTYTVHGVNETPVQRDVVIDGVTVAATVPGLAVELTSPYGSIALQVSGPLTQNHPFTAGREIEVTFGGND